MGLVVTSESAPPDDRPTARITLIKPRTARDTADFAPLVAASAHMGVAALSRHLAQPVFNEKAAAGCEDARAREGAKQLCLLVRACAAHGALPSMLEALQQGQQLGLPGNNYFHQHGVSTAIAALRRAGHVKRAIRVYEEGVVRGLAPSSLAVLQLCATAARGSRSDAARGIELALAAVDDGASLAPQAVAALLHACARAGDGYTALRVYRSVKGEPPPPSREAHLRREAEGRTPQATAARGGGRGGGRPASDETAA
eukprot:1108676-Prymnesium_polylepis.1